MEDEAEGWLVRVVEGAWRRSLSWWLDVLDAGIVVDVLEVVEDEGWGGGNWWGRSGWLSCSWMWGRDSVQAQWFPKWWRQKRKFWQDGSGYPYSFCPPHIIRNDLPLTTCAYLFSDMSTCYANSPDAWIWVEIVPLSCWLIHVLSMCVWFKWTRKERKITEVSMIFLFFFLSFPIFPLAHARLDSDSGSYRGPSPWSSSSFVVLILDLYCISSFATREKGQRCAYPVKSRTPSFVSQCQTSSFLIFTLLPLLHSNKSCNCLPLLLLLVLLLLLCYRNGPSVQQEQYRISSWPLFVRSFKVSSPLHDRGEGHDQTNIDTVRLVLCLFTSSFNFLFSALHSSLTILPPPPPSSFLTSPSLTVTTSHSS